MITSSFPILGLLPQYSVAWARADLIAGLTIGIFVIPQGMAYALLAGLPVQYGLYSSFTPAIVYTFLGTSKHMHIGPFALISLMVGDTIEGLGTETEEEVVRVALTLSFMIGTLLIIMAIFRLGFIVTFLSDPVLEGFTVSASLLICTSQIKHIFGLDISRASFIDTVTEICQEIKHTNPAAVIVSALSFISLLGSKWYSQNRNLSIPIPIELIVVVLATFISTVAELNETYGLPIVGEIPAGLPQPALPDLSLLSSLIVPAITITLVLFVICASIVKTFSMKHNYETNENQELYAMGFANLVGSFWLCYPSCGSLSRSAVVSNIGGKSQIFNLFVSLLLMITLLSFAPLLKGLPNAVLGSIILVAFRTLLAKIWNLRVLWRVGKSDFLCWTFTFLATLLLGTTYGLLTGFVVSIIALLQQSAQGQVAQLANLPGTSIYRNVDRFPEAKTIPGVAIVRFGGGVNFVNRKSYKEELLTYLKREPRIHTIAIDMSMANGVDVSGLNMLKSVTKIFKTNEIEVLLVGCRGPVRSFFQKSKFSDEVGMDFWFVDVQSAIDYLRTQETSGEHVEEGRRSNRAMETKRQRSTMRQRSITTSRELAQMGITDIVVGTEDTQIRQS